jgi:hypothetical protein
LKQKTTKIFLALCVVMLFGCTYNIQITQRDVATWANNIYSAQYDDYLTWFDKQPDESYVLKPNVPEKQIDILVAKKAIFTELEPLLVIYSLYVETGVAPAGTIIVDVEARLVKLVNDLITKGAK